MLRNFVFETASAPGSAVDVALGGAPAGRVPFAAVYADASLCYYFLNDGTQAEWGVGTFHVGSPNRLSRTTVIGNTAGTTARLNFAGLTRVYNDIPAERSLWADQNSITQFPGDAALQSVGGGQIAGFRNVLMNGDMVLGQRGTSFTQPGAGTYTLDRWMVTYDGSGATHTANRTTNPLPQQMIDAGFQWGMNRTISALGTGNTYQYIHQRVEGVRTLAGKTATFSLWVYGSVPFTGVLILQQYFGTGGSPSPTLTLANVNVPVTTTAQKFSVTYQIPSISGKTLGTNGDDWLGVFFGLPAQTIITAVVTGMQLEPGSVATPFEFRSPSVEQPLCQRYFYNVSAYVNATTIGAETLTFPTAMRATPTVSGGGAGYTSNLISNKSTAHQQTTAAVQTLAFSAEL
jgi:hypothetical protein